MIRFAPVYVWISTSKDFPKLRLTVPEVVTLDRHVFLGGVRASSAVVAMPP
jgi:hypothetical protein